MSIFEGFESFQEVTDGLQVVYGVNILRVDAEMKTQNPGTVGELIECFGAQMGIPTNARIFIDGRQASMNDRIPGDAKRIEIVKASGEKGNGQLTVIPLAAADAVAIEVIARDTEVAIGERIEKVGTMSANLLGLVTLPGGVEVIAESGAEVVLGRRHREVVETRHSYRQLAVIRRRAPVSMEEALAGLNPIETRGSLAAGQKFQVIISGETRKITVAAPAPTAPQSPAQQLPSPENVDSDEEFDESEPDRAAELAAMPFRELIELAKSLGIKATGRGRNRKAVEADILAAG